MKHGKSRYLDVTLYEFKVEHSATRVTRNMYIIFEENRMNAQANNG